MPIWSEITPSPAQSHFVNNVSIPLFNLDILLVVPYVSFHNLGATEINLTSFPSSRALAI
jgi:hypothetical protein